MEIFESLLSTVNETLNNLPQLPEISIWGIFLGVLLGIFGIFLGVVVLLLISPFYKGILTNDPKFPDKFALFTQVEPGRSKLKMRGGRAIGILREKHAGGGPEWSANFLWSLYEKYVYAFIGMRVIGIPLIQKLYTYKLPRYRAIDIDGKKIFSVVDENDLGFRTDHIRNAYTTWYFEFSGAEVDTVPATVKGSVQIRILEGREMDALFKTDSWNVLLDQALNSVIRSIMRSQVSLDQIMGSVSQDIWNDAGAHEDTYEKARDLLRDGLKNYRIETGDGAKTLPELIGLQIDRIDIIDFAPDLSPDELVKLSAPAILRQQARARSLAGQGDAEYQKKVLEAVQSGDPKLAKASIKAEAFVKAAGSGSLDALVAGALKKLTS